MLYIYIYIIYYIIYNPQFDIVSVMLLLCPSIVVIIINLDTFTKGNIELLKK